MMLFRPEHIQPILNRTKTQTRRLWKTRRVKVGSLHKCYSGGLPIGKCRLCKGSGKVELNTSYAPYEIQTYAIVPCPDCHGTGKLQPFATVRITGVWQENLSAISETDAKAEGHDTQMAYWLAFEAINYKRWNPAERDPLVWAVEFELMEGEQHGS